MPIFVHLREVDADKGPPLGAMQDLFTILQTVGVEPTRVCIHCFCGSNDDLQQIVARGYFVGLTGFIARKKKGSHLRALLAQDILSMSRLMIETDCPYMKPDAEYIPIDIGVRGRSMMEPCILPAVCHAIAECTGVAPAIVAETTTANAIRFFDL